MRAALQEKNSGLERRRDVESERKEGHDEGGSMGRVIWTTSRCEFFTNYFDVVHDFGIAGA